VIVVLDSNVWVSALEFGGTPAFALKQALTVDQLAISDFIEQEVVRVLTQKFAHEPTALQATLEDLLRWAHRVQIRKSISGICRDPDDDSILALTQHSCHQVQSNYWHSGSPPHHGQAITPAVRASLASCSLVSRDASLCFCTSSNKLSPSSRHTRLTSASSCVILAHKSFVLLPAFDSEYAFFRSSAICARNDWIGSPGCDSNRRCASVTGKVDVSAAEGHCGPNGHCSRRIKPSVKAVDASFH
jgi:predicted nucleic acid-binding protein